MPYATNPVDGFRTYFEDSEAAGPPVLFYTGFADPLEVAKASRLAQTLSGQFRLIFADHRGQGGSDKPRDIAAYALPTRVADAVAVLDALGIERAHFLGSSWGARLGFALGEYAPDRCSRSSSAATSRMHGTSIHRPRRRSPQPSPHPDEKA